MVPMRPEMPPVPAIRRPGRGPVVPSDPRKTRITIRLDTEILDWFRERVDRQGGGSYQRLINEALKEHIQRRREPLEETLRRVLREELETRPIAVSR